MATLKVNQAKPVNPPKTYTLTLSEKEAVVLMYVLGQVTGSEDANAASGITGRIYDMLDDATDYDIDWGDNDMSEVVNFNFPTNDDGRSTFNLVKKD
jgi:hypothetical protein